MPFIACKLPNGLQIDHKGQSIVLKGSNIGENLELVSANGFVQDNRQRASGFGITELSPAQTEIFVDWMNVVTYKGGDPKNGKLDFPFEPIEKGIIQGPFASREDAIKECEDLASLVSSGFEGLDPNAQGHEDLETDPESKAQPKKK